MGARVSISAKSARALLELGEVKLWKDGRGWEELCALVKVTHRAFEEIRSALKPKKSLAPARKRRAAKKASKREETAEIREAVVKRAGGFCECGCRFPLTAFRPGEMDHFFPKARTKQSVGTCWLLEAGCHRDKTHNRPSAAFWLEKFINHAHRHNYFQEAATARNRLGTMETMATAALR